MNEETHMKATRNRTSRILFFSLALSLAASASIPCEEAKAPEPIGLERARELAISSSSELKRLGIAVDAASLAEKKKRFASLPSLSTQASAGLSYSDRVEGFSDAYSLSAGLQASQSVYDGGRNSVERAIARLSTSMAREDARAAYDAAVNGADAAYYGFLKAKAKVKAAEDDFANAKQNLSLAREKFSSGMATTLDVLEKEATERGKETSLSQARGDFSIAKAKFSSLTGLKGDFSVAEIDFKDFEAIIASLGSYTEIEAEALVSRLSLKASSSSPDLVKAALNAESSKKGVSLAKAAYMPSFVVSAGPSLGYSGEGFSGSASLALKASVPLDFWNMKADVDSKEKVAEQSALSLEKALKDADMKIRSAVYTSLSQARSVSSSRAAFEYASSFYKKSLELYSLSASSASDLSSAQLLVSANRRSLIEAQYGFLGCLSDLRALCSYGTDAELLAALEAGEGP
jgi:outer membrane protein